MIRVRWLLLLSLVLAAAPGSATSQSVTAAKRAKEYRILPFDGDMAGILMNQLLDAKARDDLINDVRQHHEKYAKLLDNERLLKAKNKAALNPDTLADLQKLIAGQLDDGLSTEDVKDLQQALEDLKKSSKQEPATGNQSSPQRGGLPQPTPPGSGLKGSGKSFDKLVNKAMDWAEHSRFAKLKSEMKNSAAFELAKERMAKNTAKAKWDLPAIDWLTLPDAAAGGLGSALPDSSGWLQAPAFSLTGTTAATDGMLLLLGALVLIVAIVAILGKPLAGRLARGPAVALAGPGPWPHPPEQISTRAQLIGAFEHVALLLLGNKARTINHRDIANDLGGTPERRQAAEELALFYEKARYDPTAGDLPPPALAAARHDLCLLAGLSETAAGDR